MTGDWGTVIALALAAAVITTVFAFSKLGLLVKARLFLARRKRAFWFDLASCPVCGSFWGTGVGVGLYRPAVTDLWGPVDWVVAWMAAWCMAALIVRHIKVALIGDTKPITLDVGGKP